MNYFTEIENRLIAAVATSDVAIEAGQISGSWALFHVFHEGAKFIGGQNRGRVPFVNITRVTSDYTYEAINVSDQGGEVISKWEIEVVVDRENQTKAYAIAQKIIKAIRADYNMSLGEQQIGQLDTHPFGMSLIISLSINNTHSDSNK